MGSHKFGHEEWNFNFNWLIGGKKYGFFEPIHRFHSRYKGKWLSLKLYTKFNDQTFYVGQIKKVYVPRDNELVTAVSAIVANGWFDRMKADIAAIGADETVLDATDPALVINACYDPADVELDPDMPPFDPSSKPARSHHYVLAFDDDAPLPKSEAENGEERLSAEKRSELQFVRAAQQGQIVDPKHARLQNRLYDWLCDKHGARAVGFEKKFVDLRVTLPEVTTFFEIKIAANAKRCIRDALGQLFEYTSYPSESKAHKWVVVGDQVPTDNDLAYLLHLVTKFNLPIYYGRFDADSGSLGVLE
ncbi:hypothetical protein ETAA8_53650 [Anatilimnocola aggregata]|uniref:Uncharacterized protein n=1 Tax=Anatilimnocola aggregata TaxID=2528021 RepID=A0A517YJ49_9BACT|nr:hypothetical protein [Anatilimnocola aggregata]QDU30246.1 hypothetical protein ETAA8_53650 [Anatilimnocola aggregata]